jgi:predicted ATP-dependent serine protease
VRIAKKSGLGDVASANELKNMDYTLINLGPFSKYFGKPAMNFKLAIHGQPGAGKTFLLLKFANWYAKNRGSVLYISAEEYGSPTLSEKLKALNSTLSENLHFGKNMETLSNYEYDLVIIDSVQAANLSIDDFHRLVEQYDLSAFIVVLQKTKDGKFKGSKEWEHDTDINAEVLFDDEGKRVLNTYKNRYQVIGQSAI